MFGSVPQPLPRAFRRQLQEQDSAKILKIIGQVEKLQTSTAGATAAGDERRLRGLPAIGRGVRALSPARCPAVASDPAPTQHQMPIPGTPGTPDPRFQAVPAWALGPELPGLDSNQQPSG